MIIWKLLHILVSAMCLFLAGKPRIGVLNVEGKALGFVFIDSTSSLSVLRHALDNQVPVLVIAWFGSEISLLSQCLVIQERKAYDTIVIIVILVICK